MNTKVCSKCKMEKDLSKFYKDSNHKDGLRSQCKDCHNAAHKAYEQTPKGKATTKTAHKAYEQTPKYKTSRNRYKQSTRGKATTKVYTQTPKDRLRRNAYGKLRTALKSGKISKPNICSICNTRTEIDGHHADYNLPLDVIWCCESCHKNLHYPI